MDENIKGIIKRRKEITNRKRKIIIITVACNTWWKKQQNNIYSFIHNKYSTHTQYIIYNEV